MSYTTTEIIQEIIRRQKLGREIDLRSKNFHCQNKAIDDPCRLKAYNCTRRSGKSIAVAIDFVETCVNYPESNCLYMALTIGSAREILWEAMKDYAIKADPNCKPHESRTEIKFPNKSRIKFTGADCSEKQMRKTLGQKYKKVAIDEAGSFTIDMNRLVYQMIRPATADYLGQIILLGTCENIRGTFFEQVTEGHESGWSVHKWTAYDNPHMVDKWTQEVVDLTTRNPNVVNASWYKTHYLNQWCADDDLLIIGVKDENMVEELPKRASDYNYILGVDLGYNDCSSFTVIAYHDYDRLAYYVDSFKKGNMLLSHVGQQVETLQKRYPFSKIKIDGANKQGVEEMRRRFGIPFESAEKTEKALFLKMLNDDIQVGNVKIVKGKCNELITEWQNLQWEDLNKEKEDSRCENHCCFPSGTLILTASGYRKIEDIKLGDSIITERGERSATHLMQGVYSGVWCKMLFSNGSYIECTGNHPFFTDRGMERADALTYARRFVTIDKWENMGSQKQLNSMGLSIEDIPNLLIHRAANILERLREYATCIWPYGRTIMGKYRKGITSTTLMGMLQTTISKIFILWRESSTTSAILKKIQTKERSPEFLLKKQLKKLESGTSPTKVESGTKSAAPLYLGADPNSGKRYLSASAKSVISILKLIYCPLKQRLAPISAKQKKEETAGKIISKKIASGVEKSTPQINTPKLNSAVYLVSHVTETVSEKRIFNLTVKDEHRYFANGILVSNSDGALYAWRECYHYLATREPVKISKHSEQYMNMIEEEEIENGTRKKEWYNGRS